ncbi:MAG: phosphatase PAP2 family protein, partial [Candidatus Omnitrophica bacterium]|nr:phosphatase PAP2 family protein [Candidatus Omnitrophota bacterium]
TVVAMRYPKMRYPAFIIAILVALSRPYLGFHYLSDISAGAILGIFVGYVATKTANACERKRK